MEVTYQGRTGLGMRTDPAAAAGRVGAGTAGGNAAAPSRTLDPRTTAALVLQAVRGIDDDELVPPGATPGLAFQPRSMLAMLVYCYANGIYGSWDVEQKMYEDPDFRALCGREYPDWRRLRRFRRENHEVLRRTLAESFRNAARWQADEPSNGRVNGVGPGAGACREPLDNFDNEAEARIERAMFCDAMEED